MPPDTQAIQAPLLLALMRGADGLFAWVADASGGAPALRRMALANLPAGLYPQRDALLADWRQVCAARELDAVWPALWRVFWATLSESGEQAAPMPQRIAPAPAPKATAAHPRAFRGTKFQPPKPAAPVLDLAAWLADDRLFDGFLARHDLARLPVPGADGAPLALTSDTDRAPTVASVLARGAGQWPAIPDAFRRAFLWRLRTRPSNELLAWLHLWRGLGGAAQGAALIVPATLCALAPHAHAWAALALMLPPPRQIIFLAAVLKQRAYLLAPGAMDQSRLAAIDALDADDDCFAAYLDAVLDNLQRKVSVAYSLEGCLLASQRLNPLLPHELRFRLTAGKACPDFRVSDIARMRVTLGPDGDCRTLRLWEDCAHAPGLAQLLRETCWEKLSAGAADTWLSIFTSTVWYDDDQTEKQNDKRWRAHLALFPAWHADLIALSGAWQEKYVRMVSDYANGWDDGDTLRASVAHLAPLLRRLCSPPFSTHIDIGHPLSSMANSFPVEGWRQLAAAGERTWLTVERACRREDDGRMIGRGLVSLARCWPAFTMRSLSVAPQSLMRVARLLGYIAWERRRQFLSETGHTVWFSTRWSELAPDDACRTLYRLCLDCGVQSPVPRRLREHFEGKFILSDAQVARHCRLAMSRLPQVLLAALEQAILRSIDQPFKLHDRSSAASHAVRLAAGIDINRKGLRRVLREQAEGQTGAYLEHPLNRAWFARHPRIDALAWQGSALCVDVDALPGARLTVASDPLDILMLGTHVGSCLGLGGLCDYSAVACLLDANKQVVYARDAAGRVLARQLLAIDERDRLVCFSVYPLNANAALLRAFHAFDQAMAASLCIDIYRHDDDDAYDVAIVLAEHWWDDGVWQDQDDYAAAT
ncbi:hypothetical protein INH39_14715 [Massilia violaceinigra]|uniref:Uncharacterized protein n=1 Tax=Massilia violaceinigra TaxID=2045208 RepID=A0ABY4AGW2_9BURK|nr:hypothetical protein [Massilia violaceinigra]UOD32801.1 hypothetical protein INH39_14715 [Massilia violaceinigra]